MKLEHIGLFEGIGGFSLAASWAGWKTVAWCEWNPFGQKVLKYHFPEAEGFGDITKTDFKKYANKIDILTGGFPCQPYSTAGKRLGKGDDRHLWPEMLRAIREIRPPWVVGENVRGLISWNGGLVFDEVQSELEAEGYEVTAFILPACGVDAPHKRERVWFVAHANDKGRCSGFREICYQNGEIPQRNENSEFGNADKRICESRITANATSNRRERERAGFETEKGLQPGPESTGELAGRFEGLRGESFIADTDSRRQSSKEYRQAESGMFAEKSVPTDWQNFPTEPPICGGNDGLPYGLVDITFPKWRNESIKAYGNAIVPQVAYQIFKAINEFEKKDNGAE
jgi:DNA (cytosine-5)-methyltransferase 1